MGASGTTEDGSSESIGLKQCVHTFTFRRSVLCLCAFAFAVQLAVSCGSYSGKGIPPMYGDFEAQRHWMEITLHLPMALWYVNGTENDLNYWGLDYPPLTAYHSLLLAKLSEKLNSSWVALHSSRGIETVSHMFFMRATVLFTMWTLYFPALAAFVYLFSKSGCKIDHFAVGLLYPGLIAIDNGHFQYNHISLGLFIIAVCCFLKNYFTVGSIVFVMAVNYKQMELYHALPIAVFLLSTSVRMPLTPSNFFKSASQLQKLFIVVLMTFAVIWAPLCARGANPSLILARVFPFYRGLFEDKVANLWCALSVLVKFKNLFDIPFLLKLSTVVVLISHIPSLISLLMYNFAENFLMGLFVSSLSFFLFSFQVHEKSILMAAICAILLWSQYPVALSWFLIISCTSMYPLCVQDGNALHLAMFVFFYFIVSPTFGRLKRTECMAIHGSCLLSFGLCVASVSVVPPQRYPHIFPLLTAIYSFIHFFGFFCYFNIVMLRRFIEKRKID